MGDPITYVGNLPLPEALLRTIEDGRWRPPKSIGTIADVFNDEPDGPYFYDFPAMAVQNRSFQRKTQAEIAEEVPGSDGGLGVTPALAVLIGDLGADMPIALDYRINETNPRVIYLGPDGWREVAPDFDSLAQRLGL